MKTFTLNYDSQEQLNRFLRDCNIDIKSSVLVQIFTSQVDKKFINNLRNQILKPIPHAIILGTTTCGEISNNGSQRGTTVISFSIFENTILKFTLIERTNKSFNLGQDIAKQFNYNDELKLILTFSDGLNTNGEAYVNGISSIYEDIIVAGGMAGDNGKFEETYVFSNDIITNNGAVAVAFYNKDLSVNTNYSFNWETVGKKHFVEKANKNRVYKIDGMSAVEFYSYYLGEDIARLLPSIGIEFPLVIERKGVKVARAVISKYDDGSLGFAGNIEEGSYVQFGHGDVQMIIDKGLDNIRKIIDHPVESIFVYSCMARHALLKDDINLEIMPLRELAPVSGFFTYGEFYHDCEEDSCSTQLLNQTMTTVAISETNTMTENITPNVFSDNPKQFDQVNLYRTQALSNLIERTTKELEDLNKDLENRIEEEVEKNSQKDSMLHMMQSQAQLGEMLEMIIHQWRQPLSAITSTVSSAQVYKSMGALSDEEIDKTFKNILSFTEHLNNTIGDFRELFKTDINTDNIPIDMLFNKVKTIVNPIVLKSKVKLTENFNYEKDAQINISVGLMLQVLLNIVKNAVDVLLQNSIRNPEIILDVTTDTDSCIIKISDNGGGIPEDIIDKIFDKRFSTKGSKGTGIGLDMSKNIVESKLKGKLLVHNENNWAVFTIILPLVK